MAWIDVTNSSGGVVRFVHKGYNYTDGDLMAVVQYDDTSVAVDSVKVHFELRKNPDVETAGYYTDGFGILLMPETKNAEGNLVMDSQNINFLKMKDATYKSNGWQGNYVSSEYTLTKEPKDTTFTLPNFWFINTWGKDTSVQSAALADDETKLYYYFSTTTSGLNAQVARNYKTIFNATNLSIAPNKSVVTDGTAPTIAIRDNGNNTAAIYGNLGTNGQNNAIKAVTLYYTTDGSNPETSSTRQTVVLRASSGASYNKQVGITQACTIKAYIVCEFNYNTTTATASGTSITYYAAPSAPSNVVLSYTKNRLTIKEPWNFTWTAATAANTNSPVAGYIFRLLREAAGSTGFTAVQNIYCNATNDYLEIDAAVNSNAWTYRENTSCTLIIQNPTDFGFAVGDRVKLEVTAYARNAADEVLKSAAAESDASLVQNAGIVNVKVPNGNAHKWVEGQVWVKVSNTEWKEADAVHVKTTAGWKESE